MIEVNGIHYREKENKEPRNPRMSGRMAQIYAMAMLIGGDMGMGHKEPERPNVDIVKEYGLIQLKKSGLSKSQRDWVVWVFEKNFERIPDNPFDVNK